MIEIELFWCCLPQPEKTAWEWVGIHYLTNPVYILAIEVETIFLAVAGASRLKRLETFTWCTNMFRYTLVIEGVEVDVYDLVLSVFGDYVDFFDEGDFACDCRCEIQRFPDPC